MNTTDEFKDTFREARLAAGLTQQAMADLFEMPKRTIENWEAGKRTPPPYVQRLVLAELKRIAKEKQD